MAWTVYKRQGYVILEETGITLVDNAGATAENVAFSSPIPAGLYPFNNKKILVTLQSTTASGADVVCDGVFQISNNNDTTGDVPGTGSAASPLWATGASVNCNVTSLTLISGSAVADLTDIWAPYGRIAILTAATDLTDSAGRMTISVCIPVGDIGMAASEFGGAATSIGKDPS